MALGVALLAGVLVASPRATSANAAAASSSGACPGDAGVTVVVDFGTLGGGIQTRCTDGPVSNGLDALETAGFAIDVIPGGFLCRIDGKPANDPCTHTPSARYYWSYWLASEPGGAWTYSDTGAGSRQPAPGSVDGWAFSDGCKREPGASTTCPTSSTSSPTTSSTTSPPGSGGSTGTTTSAPGSSTTSPGDPTTSGAGDTTTTFGDPLASADRPGDAADDPTADDVALGDADAATTRSARRGGGSPVGSLVGASVVVVFGLGAVAQSRRRRVHGAGSDMG